MNCKKLSKYTEEEPPPVQECRRIHNPTNLDMLPRDRDAFFRVGRDFDIPFSTLTGYKRKKTATISKGLAFTHKERQILSIHGLYPVAVETMEQQLARCVKFYGTMNSYEAKVLYLWRLESINQRLYFNLLATDFEHFHSLLSTTIPNILNVFIRPTSLYITIMDKGHIYQIIQNWPYRNVLDIIVSDGGAAFGATDIGATIAAVVIQKLHLHTLVAGMKPKNCLPIILDVGTNSVENLQSPFYIGVKEKRVTGQLYDEFIDEFMTACVRRFGPRAFIQFDDFAPLVGYKILRQYQLTHCCCNNDIQCAAATGLAGVFASKRITNIKFQDNVFLLYGSRARVYGTAHLIYLVFKREGLNHEAALKRIWLFDSRGLVVKNRPAGGLNRLKMRYAQDHEPIDTLEEGVEIIKPTVLMGVSGHAKAFTKAVLNGMVKHNKIPLIFSLSTPQAASECTPEEAFAYTKGQCLYVASSYLLPIKYANKYYTMGQCHSGFISPGIALGVMLSGLITIPDEIFLVAAERLADLVPPDNLAKKCLYPLKKKLRCSALQIADAVMCLAYRRHWATLWPEPDNRMAYIKSHLYDLDYPEIIPEFFCTRDWDIGTKESLKHYPPTTYEGD